MFFFLSYFIYLRQAYIKPETLNRFLLSHPTEISLHQGKQALNKLDIHVQSGFHLFDRVLVLSNFQLFSYISWRPYLVMKKSGLLRENERTLVNT